jgi:predicted HNH restriction endonuclease
LTWNPKEYPFRELPEQAQDVSKGRPVEVTWTCKRKDATPGDRFFLIKLGKGLRGIIASGWITTESKLRDHWKKEAANKGVKQRYAGIKYDALLDPAIHDPLPIAVLKSGQLSKVHWSTYSSGIRISQSAVPVLENLWRNHLDRTTEWGADISDDLALLEGKKRYRMAVHRKRESRLRDAKVEKVLRLKGRLVCEVPGCGFDFVEIYGELGQGFAHVHHCKPLSSSDDNRPVRLSELKIVCPNCHAMIHRGGECRDMDKLIVRRRS